MPHKLSQTNRKSLEQTFLTIVINDYKARTNTGPNLQLLGTTRHVSNDEEHAIVSNTVLDLTGICIHPDIRAEDRYEITLYGEPGNTGILRPRIKDLHRRGKDGIYEYRQYRGKDYPIYNEPPSLGYLQKVRGESRWTAWASVSRQMVTDALTLLIGHKPIYVSVHETKFQRNRLVRSLSVQSTDPAEE